MPYRDRINAPWPKKLLALDGSGIRGVITLEVLRRLESMPAERLGGAP
jgi:patatin-like phospholipase/acyl hydrolase